ncbi:hypothetical protein E4U42_005129 [Claviceps africana]|uniref:RING-type E3 ubiquitin transferase n=1 Tax=Claviceps africana TaxID=83212 RepID=A0A8K0J4M7_9HYPO|nr:hypothetical protein E4U42_005129 [Claviceps africana]
MASPSSPHGRHLSTEIEAGGGVTDENDENSVHLTYPHTETSPASPVAHVPQNVAQPDTARVQIQGTQSPRMGWPSAQEHYTAAYSRVRSGNDRQHASYEPGPRLNAPNNDRHQAADTARIESQDSGIAPSRGGMTALPDFALPRWQPDVEVTYCPICRTQFSFFVRKHHCRIIIPHQYIVRPPGSDLMMPPRLLIDGLSSGFFESNTLSGGERVRLCNPCVPDPNTAPPQSPSPSVGTNLPPSHYRSRSSLASSHGTAHPSNRYGTVFTGIDNIDPLRLYSRARSITMDSTAQGSPSTTSSALHMSAPDTDDRETFQRLLRRFQEVRTISSSRNSHASFGYDIAASSSRQRALPPPPPIAEEDECPVCHHELPARSLLNFESLREGHINACVQAHSTYGSPRRTQGEEATPAAPPRRSGMYAYLATEKDCVDDAECTICLEEFIVGIPMARLESSLKGYDAMAGTALFVMIHGNALVGPAWATFGIYFAPNKPFIGPPTASIANDRE